MGTFREGERKIRPGVYHRFENADKNSSTATQKNNHRNVDTLPTVSVWTDPGAYDYFYINYGRPLVEMSLSLFRLSTVLISASGVITPTEIRRVSGGVYQVFAPLPQNFLDGYPVKGLCVVQFTDLWITYRDGTKVPVFAAYLAIDAMLWWSPGLLREADTLRPVGVSDISESAELVTGGDQVYTAADTANLLPVGILSAQDTMASIIYTPQEQE